MVTGGTIRRLPRTRGLANLKESRHKPIFENRIMTTPPLASYLRSHRLKTGMSQRELADLVGFIAHHQVSNHEQLTLIPTLLVAFSYQAVFCVSAADLFPGLFETVRANVEDRLLAMERTLQNTVAKGRKAEVIARKLEWLAQRRNPAAIDFEK